MEKKYIHYNFINARQKKIQFSGNYKNFKILHWLFTNNNSCIKFKYIYIYIFISGIPHSM